MREFLPPWGFVNFRFFAGVSGFSLVRCGLVVGMVLGCGGSVRCRIWGSDFVRVVVMVVWAEVMVEWAEVMVESFRRGLVVRR